MSADASAERLIAGRYAIEDTLGRGAMGTVYRVRDTRSGRALALKRLRRDGARAWRHRAQLERTVRFVAADYEEQGGLEGARAYAQFVKKLAGEEGFRLVAAVDNEQSGWDCALENECGFTGSPIHGRTPVDIYSCSGDGEGYDHPALGDALAGVAAAYGGLDVSRGCIGENSDHYAMWEIGVPAVVFSEHDPFSNDHFDMEGGDTYDKIDQDYFFQIAQIGVTFAAEAVGITQ